MRWIVSVGLVLAQPLSLSDIWRAYRYYAQTHDLVESLEGWYGQSEQGRLYRIGPSLRAESLQYAPPLARWVVSPADKEWIAWQELQRGFRHSTAGRLQWFRGEKSQLLPGTSWREVAFTPDGSAIVAADDHNLYLLRAGSLQWDTLTRYPSGFQAGTTDWLYEEEFGFTQAFAISPSGRYLAYLLFDNSHTATYPLTFYGATYPTVRLLAYPKVGERNPRVHLRLLDLQTREEKELFADTVGGYLPWFGWSFMGDYLYFTHLNRPQNRFTLYQYEPDGSKRTPFLSDSTRGFFTWDDRRLVILCPDQPELFYLAAGQGAPELWRYDYKGRRVAMYKVPGLRNLIGCACGKVFFHAAGATPLHQRIGYLPLSGRSATPTWITADTLWAEGRVAGQVLHLQLSRFTDPPREEVRSACNPTRSMPLPDLNASLRPQIPPINVRFFQFSDAQGQKRWAYLLLPAAFDSTRRYPVVLTFYGGPGSQQVSTEFKNISFFWQAYLTQKGYIVACVDGRGTALYPTERFSIYRRLGLPETEDIVAFLRWLRSQPYVGKIGAFGWSYGGYMALRVAFAAPEALAASVAVAPVTDWRLYDSAYTERFMDLLDKNSEGYAGTSLPPRGQKLSVPVLLIHGDADDNVHVQHSYRFLEKLLSQQPEAPIEWRIFPNQNHGIGTYRYRVYWELEQFFGRHLRAY